MAALRVLGRFASARGCSSTPVRIGGPRAWSPTKPLFHRAAALALWVLLTAASQAQAETWKIATTRASDGAPFFVDTDYLVERGDLLEVHVRYKVAKNLLTLLLPDAEAEERYVIDCGHRKFGVVYQKVTRLGTSTVERDALPTAVILADVPAGSMAGYAVDWACSEHKTRVAARQPPPPSTNKPGNTGPQVTIPEDAVGRYQWKLIASAVPDSGTNDVYDTYVAELSVQDADKRIFVFLARSDYRPSSASPDVISHTSVVRWAVGCGTKKLVVLEGIEFRSGKVAQLYPFDEKTTPMDVQPGTVGASYYDFACKVSAAQSMPSQNQPAVQAPPSQPTTQSLSFGTAWLSDRGYIVTAYHVIDGAAEITLRTWDGKVYSATLVRADKPNDVAILSSSASAGLNGMPIAKSTPGLGARVFTIGYPHPDVMGVAPKLTSGDISALSGLQDDPRLLQISTPVQAGNSGGPLINMNGEVVGLISAQLNAPRMLGTTGDLTQNVNYALKARYVAGLLDDLSITPSGAPGAKPSRLSTLEDLAGAAQHSVFLVIGR